MPLHYSPTGEPYIRLPAPHSHLILTPPRAEVSSTSKSTLVEKSGDVEGKENNKKEGEGEGEEERVPLEADIAASCSALNDKRVYMYLEGPPHPYEREHAVAWWKTSYVETQKMLRRQQQQIEESENEGKQIWFDGCPFRDIRDTSLPFATLTTAEGSAAREDEAIEKSSKIGDFMILRYPFYELPLESEERRIAQERNAALPAGHEDLIWCIGFWMLSSHHGKGIMSTVLNSLIHEWAIPKMNMRIMKSSAYAGNEASIRVFKKCGFVVEQTVQQATRELPGSKGGGKRDLVVMKWERS